MKYSWGLAFALLALSACEEEAAEVVSTETGGEAAGEVLGGTISDEMIALEELTSTSPPAERTTSERAAASREQAPEQAPEPAESEPEAPITAGPSGPIPETQEAEPPEGDPAA